jgi:putative transposase
MGVLALADPLRWPATARSSSPEATGGGKARLKRVLADQTLANQARREVLEKGVALADTRAVVAALIEWGVSERRACQQVGLSRSTYRYQPHPAAPRWPDEQHLREPISALARPHRRVVYRRVTALRHRGGAPVNHKRVQRIWRAEKLSLPRRAKKRYKPNDSPAALPNKALQRGHVWSHDFIFDRTEQGQPLKMLTVLDEYTRECHMIKVGLHLDRQDVIAVMGELIRRHGAPEYVRRANGGEFIAGQLTQWLEQQGCATSHRAPGQPCKRSPTAGPAHGGSAICSPCGSVPTGPRISRA